MIKIENQRVYNIYSACRLCGSLAGYKMPIIQSIIDVDCEETELKHKIKECLQIEVSLSDRMPPLICELCVDKVNNFFEFRLVCQENNRMTRLRLGLPPQDMPRIVPNLEDSIIKTEPVYICSDSEESEPLSKHAEKSKFKPKAKRKEPDVSIKIENYQPPNKPARSPSPDRRDSRHKRARSPSAPGRSDAAIALNQLQRLQKRSRPAPKSVLRRREVEKLSDAHEHDYKLEDNSLLLPRSKRPRDVPIETPPPPTKKDKSSEPVKPPRPGPKSSKAPMPPPPIKPTTKSAPKSKKREVSPAPVPTKSRCREVSPIATITGRRRDVVTVAASLTRKSGGSPATKAKDNSPAARAKKRGESPPLAPRTRRMENSPATSASKKHEPSPRSRRVEDPSSPAHAGVFKCLKCGFKAKTVQGFTSHMKIHAPAGDKTRSESPKPEGAPEPRAPSPPRVRECAICGHKAKTHQALTAHIRNHVPAYTQPKFACNPCEVWFATMDEVQCHLRAHSRDLPYTCSKCYDDFQTPQDYELHFTRNQCLPTYEVPDVKCEVCWRLFPTYKLLEDHKCPGENSRPGGNCSKCDRSYTLMKYLMAHEMKCNPKKKETKVEPAKIETVPVVDPDVSSRLLPMQVRIVRCDALLENMSRTCVDVSDISHRFGLDHMSTYPYLYSASDSRIKSEPAAFDAMVAINDDFKKEYLNDDETYVHWDSETSDDSDCDDRQSVKTEKSADSLSTLSLKTIFSQKCLGKVPRKKRKIKSEDSNSVKLGIKTNIDRMIEDLGNESQDSDSLLDKGDENSPSLNLFDSLKTATENVDELSTESTKEFSEEITTEKVPDISICDSNDRAIENDEQSTAVKDSQVTNIVTDSISDATHTDDQSNKKEVEEREDRVEKRVEDTISDIIRDESEDNQDHSSVVKKDDPKNGCIVNTHEEIRINGTPQNDEPESSINSEVAETQDNAELKEVTDDDISIANNHLTTDESQSSDVISFKHLDENDSQSSGTSKVYTNIVPENDSTVSDDVSKVDTESNSKDTMLSTDSLEKSAEKFNELNEDEKRFMAELDAQIGENSAGSDVIGENGLETDVVRGNDAASDLIGGNKETSDVVENISKVLNQNDVLDDSTKLSLEELLPKQSEDLRSLDLDSISDEEFNFDL